MDGPGSRERDEDDGHRDVRYQLDTPKPPARRLSRSTMSLKISPEKSAKPPQFQFFPSTPKACLTVPMTPGADPSIPTGFSPQLYQAYTSNRATDFFFKQLDGFKDIMTTAKSRLSFGERAVFWLYDKIREWSRMWLTHFFLLFIAAGYCAAGALIFQTVEGSHKKKDQVDTIFKERNRLIVNIAELMGKRIRNNDTTFTGSENLIRMYESIFMNNLDKTQMKQEWNYLNALFYCGTVFTTIDILQENVLYDSCVTMTMPNQKY